MSGIIYFKKPQSEYYNNMIGYDYTKNVSLVGSEIDNNFFVLEGRDLYSLSMEGSYLVFVFVDGTEKKVKINNYSEGCGIKISDNCENDTTGNLEISVKTGDNGAIHCFNGGIRTDVKCGLSIVHEEESCEGFRKYLVRMLGGYIGNLYINSLMKLNGEFYGGLTSTDACYVPDCHNDQFYNDYLGFLKSGSIAIDVCGIECLKDGTARILVDNETIVLDDCGLKVNYGCGLSVEDADETDYIIWLSENWERLEGTEYVEIESYISLSEQVNGEYYTDGTQDWKNDQFYEEFEKNEKYPKLKVGIDDCGGLYCSENGLSIDYGCGLKVNCEPTCEDFMSFAEMMGFEIKIVCGNDDWKNTEVNPYYDTFINCWNKGVLQANLSKTGAISCINGGLGVNIGDNMEFVNIKPSYKDDNKDSYHAFLENNWGKLVGDTPSFSSYINNIATVNGEYFGNSDCTPSCDNKNIWFNDQFFCYYVSYVNAGKLNCTCDKYEKIEEIQANWEEQNPKSVQYIQNKPEVGNAKITLSIGDEKIASFKLDSQKDENISIDKTVEYTEIEYDALKELIENSGLVKGKFYRIIDYETTTIQNGTKTTGNVFDLVVMASSEKTLFSKAYAVASERDDKGYFTNDVLSNWEIWYDFNPQRMKYAWYDKYITMKDKNTSEEIKLIRNENLDTTALIDSQNTHLYGWYYILPDITINNTYTCFICVFTTNEKPSKEDNVYGDINLSYNIVGTVSSELKEPKYGVIYRMIDENGNDCPYDFKNILMDPTGLFSSDVINDSGLTTGTYYYTFTIDNGDNKTNDFSSNILCNNNVINSCTTNYDLRETANDACLIIPYNVFYTKIEQNAKITSISSNKLNSNAKFNIFSGQSEMNELESESTYNALIKGCTMNKLYKNCTNNILNNSHENILNDNCNNNTFDDSLGNVLDRACDSISLVNDSNNHFCIGCKNIKLDKYCNNNNFGNGCRYINFSTTGDEDHGKYCSYNSFGDSCMYVNFGSTGAANNNILRFVKILSGTSGTAQIRLELTALRNANAEYLIGYNSNGEIVKKYALD